MGMGGLNQVLLGPPTRNLFDTAAFRTWASWGGVGGAQCGAALGPLYCHGVSGIRGLAFVLKENVRGSGWGGWRGHTQGSRGDQNKQTYQITFSDAAWTSARPKTFLVDHFNLNLSFRKDNRGKMKGAHLRRTNCLQLV